MQMCPYVFNGVCVCRCVHVCVNKRVCSHLTEGFAWLHLCGHILHHPLLVATELIITFNIQELNLFFPSILFTLQSTELGKDKHTHKQTNTFY